MTTETTNVSMAMTAKINRVACVMIGLVLTAGWARALMVVEDFDFYANGQIGGNAGGSGFKGAWSTNYVTSLFITNTVNLFSGTPGYAVSSLSTGALTASITAGYMSKRAFAAPIYGTATGRTVWFSTLIRSTASARIGWSFNPTDYLRNTAISGFLAVGTDLRILTNGVLFSSGKTLTVNTTHVILGSVKLYDTGQSTVCYWIDPSGLTSTDTLGQPDFSYASVFNNTFGADLANIGIEGYGDCTGLIDAIRISDGNGNAAQAFKDVTRATPKALFGPVRFGSLADVTNHFALINAIATNDWISSNDGNYGEGGFLRPGISPSGTHHVFVPDSDGAVGGGNDIFGDCTIDYDMRTSSSTWMVGAFFLGDTQSSKHWILNDKTAAGTNRQRAFYNRSMLGAGGGSVQSEFTHPLDLSDWRHVRLDVRRVNTYTQVQVRIRIWNTANDFRATPGFETNITYDAANSVLTDGEVGFSAFYQGSSSDIDNVAIYRYGGAPDWFVPKGAVMQIK
jgi:hypothetical protein